jgi:Bacterial pre-peptidase C-terminal domain
VLNDKDGFNTNYTLTIAPSDTPSSLPSPATQPAYPSFVPVLPSPDPGSSLNTAYNVDILSSNRVYQDSVGTTDGDDYYKFVVPQSSTFSARVAGATSDLRLTLIYDANNNGLIDSGEELEIDYLSASYESYASISRNLGAGTYFVKVRNDKVGYNTNYTLNLSA